MGVFEEYSYYYDLLYKDKNYFKEAEYIDKLLKDEKKEINTILNMGCGTGNHDVKLSEFGYKIHGIDLSEEMISEAKQKECKDLSFEVADIRNYKSKEKYDAVTSLFHVISYQNTNEDLLNTFKTAYNSLKEGGVFIFDCWYGSGVLTDLPTVRVKKVENDKCKVIRIATPEMFAIKNLVHVNYETIIIDKKTKQNKVLNEVHKMRYLFTPEVEYMLGNVGFNNIKCYEYGTMDKPDFKSWYVCFICKKE